MTERVDLREPNGGREGGLRPSSWFSLFSSFCSLTAGEAGIVLRRFRSAVAVAGRPVEVALPAVPGRVVRDAGVAGVFRRPEGLVTEGRVVVVGRAEVLLAGVPTALRVVDVANRSVVDGARDIRFGLAEMPSFLSSVLSSATELIEVRLRCAAVVVGVVVAVVLRTVLGTVERTGGLLSEEEVVVRDVEVGAVRDVVVEGVVRDVVVVVLGAAKGRRAVVVPDLGVALSSFSLSDIMGDGVLSNTH